ncbi:MAG: hypothetical protein JSU86_04250, partial [Phycisphaerales bacterium]
MKRHWKHRYFLVAVAFAAIGATDLTAEEPVEWCDTYEHWVAKVGYQGGVAGEACLTWGTCETPSVRDLWIPDSSTPIIEISIKFNIFCNDHGENCGADSSDVAAQMTQLNLDYEPHHIHFTENTEYIWDSTYRDLDLSQVDEMKNTYADDPAHQLNVYVVGLPGGLLGRGTFPWDPDALGNLGGIILDDEWFGEGQMVLTHESGHNLGLLHTHRGVSEVEQCSACYERADGVDGDITGDFASDTPPTPKSYVCSDPPGDDPCSVPPRPWAPTQPENYMSYAGNTCWTQFTSQQAGRKHCWMCDVLKGWTSGYTNEVPGSTCQDGIDNDCDGYADCDDVDDCKSDPGCRCYDNGGNSPLVVCVDWDGADLPEPDHDFDIDFVADPPDVDFRTGNHGWVVLSHVSGTIDTPGNLGNVRIDPTLPTEDFSVTIAHGDSAGAANVASISLVGVEWTGQSNLSGGGIAGSLLGDLVVQEDSAGQGGDVSFTIDGHVQGDITARTISSLSIGGNLSGNVDVDDVTGTMTVTGDFLSGGYSFTADDISGWLSIGGNAYGHVDLAEFTGYFGAHDISGSLSIGGNAYGYVELAEFTGSLSVTGDVDFVWLIIWGSGSGDITGGAVSGSVVLANGDGNAYSGTATFSSVAADGYVGTWAPLSRTIHVTGNVDGTVLAWPWGSDPALTETGLIDIDGNVSGQVTASSGEVLGDIDIAGNITSTGRVQVGATMSGDLTGGAVSGSVTLASGEGNTYSGTATFSSVAGDGVVKTEGASLSGTIHVTGNVDGSVLAWPSGPNYALTDTGLIDIDGDVSGCVEALWGKVLGDIDIGGDITSTGHVQVEVNILGDLTVSGDAAGEISIGGDALGYIDIWKLSGSLGITGDVYQDVLLTQASSGAVTAGTVKGTGLVKLGQGPGNTYTGTATFAAIESPGTVMTSQAALGGTIHVTGDVPGTVAAIAFGSNPGLLYGGLIDVDGNVSGYVEVSEDAVGDIDIAGNITSTGHVLVTGDISGDVTVSGDVDGEILANSDSIGTGEITGAVTITGEFDGNICADNLYPDECLPANIDIQSFGPDWTVCDLPACICNLDAPTTASGEEGFDKNRYLSFVPANAGLQTALRLTLQGTALEWWVDERVEFCENAGQRLPPPEGCGPAPGLPSTT